MDGLAIGADGASFEEIAEEIGMSVKTTREIFERAIRKFGRGMEARGYGVEFAGNHWNPRQTEKRTDC